MRILSAIKSIYRIPKPSADKVEEAKQEKLFFEEEIRLCRTRALKLQISPVYPLR